MVRDQRRLAAIVSADVAGYSRLMGRDDSATLAALKAHRRELIDPKIADYGGRIVKTTGDGLLLEFPSVVDAVRCAVDVQCGMAERNAGVPADQRIEFRIGINVGDIIIDGDDIYGDGVNVAARLQALAEPSQICVSKVVRDQVADKLSFAFEDLGAQQVKNIARSVEVYRVDLGGAMPDLANHGRLRWLRLTRSRKWQLVGAGMVAVGITAVVVGVAPRLLKPAAAPNPPLMSVAVAPLAAPQGDAQAARFADALTRDLVSRLGRVNGVGGRLRVLAPQGAPANEVVDPGKLGRNARYVLEGNVLRREDGNAVNLQLVDTSTGGQIWSERNTLQDSDVSADSSARLRSLAQRMRTEVVGSEKRRVLAKAITGLSAPELVLHALASWQKDGSLAGVLQAREQVDQALQLDPNWVPALLTRFRLTEAEAMLDPKADGSRIDRQMDEDTTRAVALDPADPFAWSSRAVALFDLGRWDAALEANAAAINLDPDDPEYLNDRAGMLNWMGRPADALPLVERALAIDTTVGNVSYAERQACNSYLLLGQAERAVAMCEKASAFGRVSLSVTPLLIAAYADHGDLEKAIAAKVELLRKAPGYTIAQAGSNQPSHPEYAKLAEKYYYAGLRKAGIPEQ